MSLRARLLAGMAFVAAVLVVVAAATTITTRDQLIDQIDARLTSFSPGGPDDRGGGRAPDDHEERPPPSEATTERLSDVYEGFIDADGVLTDLFTPNVGADEPSAPRIAAADIPAAGSGIFTTEAIEGGTTYRVLARRSTSGTRITALPMNDVERSIDRLMLVEIIGAAAILAALGIVSWWVVHLGIRPVKEMTSTASRIAGGDLAVRVPESASGTESGQLAVALNQMLGRIEGALDERAASERRLRRFVADASHELRTPVTTIRGYAELYRHGGLADDAALADAMRRTEHEAARMGRLVDDMLTLAQLDEQRPLDRRRLDLNALARDAAADASATAPDRKISTDIADEAVAIDGDEDRLRQVIANVMGNVLLHTAPGTPIAVSVRRGPGTAVLEIADQGQGMPAEMVERVTERFFRVDTARSRHRGGSGLGLAIVADTMTAHGGSLDIESTPGRGTTARLTFPSA